MTYAEIQAEIVKVDAALSVALDASSYSVGGRSLSRQEIDQLRNRRTELVRMLKATPDDTDPQNIIPAQSTTITSRWNW